MNQSITIVEMQERLEMIPTLAEIVKRQDIEIAELRCKIDVVKTDNRPLSVEQFLLRYDFIKTKQTARKIMDKIGKYKDGKSIYVQLADADKYFMNKKKRELSEAEVARLATEKIIMLEKK